MNKLQDCSHMFRYSNKVGSFNLITYVCPDGDNFVTKGFDIIILDDEPIICESISNILRSFYTWGDIHPFTEMNEAISHVFVRDVCIGIFIVDVFLEERMGFQFLDAVRPKNPMIYKDAVMITGNASDDVVDMCLASGINYLLEKPIRPYELQFTVRSVIDKYVRVAMKLNKIHDPMFLYRFDHSPKNPAFNFAFY